MPLKNVKKQHRYEPFKHTTTILQTCKPLRSREREREREREFSLSNNYHPSVNATFLHLFIYFATHVGCQMRFCMNGAFATKNVSRLAKIVSLQWRKLPFLCRKLSLHGRKDSGLYREVAVLCREIPVLCRKVLLHGRKHSGLCRKGSQPCREVLVPVGIFSALGVNEFFLRISHPESVEFYFIIYVNAVLAGVKPIYLCPINDK